MELIVTNLLKFGIQRTDQYNWSMFRMGGLIYEETFSFTGFFLDTNTKKQ